MLFKKTFNLFHGVVKRRFERAHRSAENFANIFVFHLVEVAHVEHQSLLLGKLSHSFLQFQLQVVAIKPFIGGKRFHRLCHVVDACGVAAL